MSIWRPVRNTVYLRFLIGVAICSCLPTMSDAFGQGGAMGAGGRRGGGGNAPHSSPSDYYRGSAPPPSQVVLTPHGGQYMNTDSNVYELVFMPLQARIYVYDKSLQPLSAKDIMPRCRCSCRRGSGICRVAFQNISLPPATAQQDYVVAVFDVSQLHDKETPITIELSGLPNRRHPTATFTPLFSSSKVRPYVARVLARKADVESVMRQRICPVCGEVLGSKGAVVKLMIGEQVLYVCGEDCVAAVREKPEKYLAPSQMTVTER